MMVRKYWKKLLFGLYCLLMLWLLFGQRMDDGGFRELQLRPLRTLRIFWNALSNSNYPGVRTHALINLVGNVVMFVPLGCLVPWIWKPWGRFLRNFGLMTGIILCVELSQYVLCLGTCDVDDLLLNLIGTTIGFVLWKLCSRFLK
jgi:glycopeptide antibiotics resistance protein